MSANDDSLTPIDPRRALGRRPGAQPLPRLQIDDTNLDLPPSPTFNPPLSPRTHHVSLSVPGSSSRTTSPSTQSASSSSPTARKFRRPTLSKKKLDTQSQRGLYETQKLLSHLLDRLSQRKSAPDLLGRAAIIAKNAQGQRKVKQKGKAGKVGQVIVTAAQTGLSVAHGHVNTDQTNAMPATGVGSEDVEAQIVLEQGEWDTETTCDLVEQTRGLLALAQKQGLDLFASDTEIRGSSPYVRPTKRKVGRFSSFASPVSPVEHTPTEQSFSKSAETGSISGRGLLERLMNSLSKLIKVDCLYHTHRFRLLRPPYGLQAACLDIASYLYDQGDSRSKVEVCELVVGGFYTMGSRMTERICEWLEGRISDLLSRSSDERNRGMTEAKNQLPWQDPFASEQPAPSIPTFAISTESSGSIPMNSPGWLKYSPTSPSSPCFPERKLPGSSSALTATDSSSPLALHLAALISQLLLAVSSTVDASSAKLSTIHRAQKLISIILSAKPDTCLDLLGIITHAPVQTRRAAVELLATYFPESVGHNAIARRPALATYEAQRMKWETGQDKVLGEDLTEDHHFIPWRVSSKEEHVEHGHNGRCTVCRVEIHGFCIRCTLCDDLRHLHCYQHNVDMQGFSYQVTTVSSNSGPTPVIIKFSIAPLRLDEKTVNSATRNTVISTRRKIGDHSLYLVNLFTMTLCAACDLPLWGGAVQAYACLNGCQRMYHPTCLAQLDSRGVDNCRFGRDIVADGTSGSTRNPFAIPFAKLKSSFEDRNSHLCVPKEDLSTLSFDAVAILYGSLWIQYQLLKNGLTSGAIVPTSYDGANSDILGLRTYLRSYEEALRAGDASASTAALDFAHVVNGGALPGQGYMFSVRHLTYCTALLRSPEVKGQHTATTLPGDLLGSGEDETKIPAGVARDTSKSFETISLRTMIETLCQDMNIQDSRLTLTFLEHLRLNDLITVKEQLSLDGLDPRQPLPKGFLGLPLLMDPSPTVELLVGSIEALLDDHDLCMNETGLSLVTKRAFPSLLCSPYALERLGSALIRWVCLEDETLHTIVKLYASKHRRLPGVRNGIKGNSSVQIYKEDRLALQARYVHPWLSAMHDQDPALYAHIVYSHCSSVEIDTSHYEQSQEEFATHIAGLALERISILMDEGLLFTVHLEMLTAWLEDLGALAGKDHIYRPLPRMINGSSTSTMKTSEQDIWDLSQITMAESKEGVARVCKWLRVLSFSGIEIPWPLINTMVDRQETQKSSLESRIDLVIAVNANSARTDPAAFARLCCRILTNFADDPFKGQHEEQKDLENDMLRRTMLVVLRAYGVQAEEIATTCLGTSKRSSMQPVGTSKRKNTAILPALLDMDEGLILSLASLLRQGIYQTETLLDFVWLLFTRSTSAANIDGFLYKQCTVLYPILWDLLDDTQVDRKCRTRILLRLMAVNPTPLEQIVKRQFHSGDRVQLRERLLSFALDLADYDLTLENLSWRRASVGLVVLFFEALLDHTDVNPDNLVILRSMLPTQLKAISECFEDYLVQSSDERRLGLVTQLHRFRLVLPSWPILSWRVIEDLLVETSGNISQMTPAKTEQTISALHDASSLQSNLITIGLNMLAAGIDIAWTFAQRFQQHVADSMALLWTHPMDDRALLALPALRSALDSTHRISVGAQPLDSSNKPRKTALVGALFVPITIDFGRELLEKHHDYITKRLILDILNIVFFKHNTRNVELAALGALQSIAEFCRDGRKDENRLYGISILQMALGRLEKDSLVRVIPNIFANLAELLVSQMEGDSDVATIEQSQVLLKTIMKTFGRSRLFVQLFKNDALSSPRHRDDMTLGKALRYLRSTEKPSADGKVRMDSTDLAIGDLPDIFKRDKKTVEQVLESFERFVRCVEGTISEEAVLAFGSFVTRLGKHVAEWSSGDFDPNASLRSCGVILRLAPVENTVLLLHQSSTLLHLCLSRFAVETDTVSQLLSASKEVARQHHTEDTARTVLFELAGSALHGLLVTPVTLDALLSFIDTQVSDESNDGAISAEQKRVLSESSTGCTSILLRSHPTLHLPTIGPEITMSILHKAGHILILAEKALPGSLPSQLSRITAEAAITQLRVFTYILFSSLQTPMNKGRERLFVLYPMVARAASLCLRASADLLGVSDISGDGAENLSNVFIVFRLVLLAARGTGLEGTHTDPTGRDITSDLSYRAVDGFWSRIWPDWNRLVTISLEPNCVNGPLKTISQTVLLDSILFLHSFRSPILVDHFGSINHVLKMIHKAGGTVLSGNGTGGTKLVKAELALKNVGVQVTHVDREKMLKSIHGDLLAGERLRGLRAAI